MIQSIFKKNILTQIKQRQYLGISQAALNVTNVNKLINAIRTPLRNEESFLKDQFQTKILPGVDETSKIKADFLFNICCNTDYTPLITKHEAVHLLGTMYGGYSVQALINLLSNEKLAKISADALKNNILIFDYFYEIERLYKYGNPFAKTLLESWANKEWLKTKKQLDEEIQLSVFKVSGEINTDDLSPAQDAWSRPDIPLHALSMLKAPRPDIQPDDPYNIGPLSNISEIQQFGNPVVFVGDVVGTGSSRKSATNSLLYHFGQPIPYVPNKNTGGFCFGSKIAPIFYNTLEDSGSVPIEMNVDNMHMGDIIKLYPYEGVVRKDNNVISNFNITNNTFFENIQAGGRINLIIGNNLSEKSKQTLNISKTLIMQQIPNKQNFTLAQKIVGKACNKIGVLPGEYCEPLITSIGSQDTTGPMTRDELKDLACLGFSCDLVMQSFCHTAAYPKNVDLITHQTLPEFIHNRGGISLRPGDGIIHSWLNRMLLPDTVGTGGDSHTRFPIGISFPAGSGLVAFAATTGSMPLIMPESVLVRFSGNIQKGVTLRDIVHSIPYFARKLGKLTLDKNNKINIFNGNILEIEGLPFLTCEQAFELSDASAERSAAGCTIKLDKTPVIEFLQSNISLLKWMIQEGYNDKNTILRRINKMENWLDNPTLLEADHNASYKDIIDINLDDIKEPILCAPNDPDHAVLLSEVQDTKIDEVFIGSCMTNIGHFRAAGKLLDVYGDNIKTKLWMAPPTVMDKKQLQYEGFYDIFQKSGVITEMPGCSLCMGNQARVHDNSNVVSTSTRNFPNRLGNGADVFLASAELSAITAIEGKIPDLKTYFNYFNTIEQNKHHIFKYMNFHKLDTYSF